MKQGQSPYSKLRGSHNQLWTDRSPDQWTDRQRGLTSRIQATKNDNHSSFDDKEANEVSTAVPFLEDVGEPPPKQHKPLPLKQKINQAML